jgi:hypothetical protein
MISYNLPTANNTHYYNRYINFITSLQNQILSDYNEEHHICPKSLNGPDDSSNLIKLSARQHFIAHWMLWKAYETSELTHAFWAMCHQKNARQQNRYNKINSKTYEILKIQRSKIVKCSNSSRWLDEEWAIRMKKTLSRAASTPTESKRRSDSASLRNKENIQKLTDLAKTRWANIEWAEETKRKIKQGNSKRLKAISIDNIEYKCTAEVVKQFNICASEVRRRIKSQTSKYISWKYIT